jgi:hypothetical protein
MKDAPTPHGEHFEAGESDGWSIAGVLTDLSGALLTNLPGEAGLAGTVELAADLRVAANDDGYN